jgi:hypothetical protein
LGRVPLSGFRGRLPRRQRVIYSGNHGVSAVMGSWRAQPLNRRHRRAVAMFATMAHPEAAMSKAKWFQPSPDNHHRSWKGCLTCRSPTLASGKTLLPVRRRGHALAAPHCDANRSNRRSVPVKAPTRYPRQLHAPCSRQSMRQGRYGFPHVQTTLPAIALHQPCCCCEGCAKNSLFPDLRTRCS